MRSFVAVVLLLASSVVVHAQPAATPLAQPAQPKTSADADTGYRMQTGIVDATTLVACLVAGGVADDTHGKTSAPAAYSIGAYMLAVPIIHAFHARPGRAIGSLAMRFFLPLAAAGLAAAAAPNQNFDKAEAAGTAAFLVGVGVAVLDNKYLAGPDEPKPTWAPTVQVSRAGLALGVQSSF
jgi:hypothetical protein